MWEPDKFDLNGVYAIKIPTGIGYLRPKVEAISINRIPLASSEQQITLYTRATFARQMEGWTQLIDKQLHVLIDRLRVTGYRPTLEVELRLLGIGDELRDYGFTKFLPEFEEKGVLTIIDAADGGRLHSSTRNG